MGIAPPPPPPPPPPHRGLGVLFAGTWGGRGGVLRAIAKTRIVEKGPPTEGTRDSLIKVLVSLVAFPSS